MRLADFSTRAHEMFESIPSRFKEGVDGLVVETDAQPHPSLPEIYTLGECRTEQYPSEYGGPGTVRSFLVLHYGSFRRLAELDAEFDWEEELWETITHELRHHLESLATEDALEVEDYVMDQNFARREGESFDPYFFHGGIELGDGLYEVDGDLFLARELGNGDLARGSLAIDWDDVEANVPLPDPLGDPHYLTVEGFPEADTEIIVVLTRRKSWWESLRASLLGSGPQLRQSRVRVETRR